MKEWLKISLQLCLFGFFNGIQPSTHFTFKILTDFRGLASDEANSFFYAQISYWRVAIGFFAFLLTDLLRYKPIIILSALSGIAAFVTLRCTSEVNFLYVTAFASSLSNATDVAYFTYIYAMVGKAHYQQVTSNSRSAQLIGRCLGAVAAQLFVMYQVMSVQDLIYITMGSKCIAFLIACTLPSVSSSIYFYQSEAVVAKDEKVDPHQLEKGHVEVNPKFSWSKARGLLWSHLRSSAANKIVLLWSFWWILLEMGFNLVYTYNQSLWHFIEPGRVVDYNGFAEMSLTLCGAIGSQLAGLLNSDFAERNSIWIVVSSSLFLGSFSVLAAVTSTVFVSYAMYVLLGATYNFIVTLTSATVARNLVQDSFALIFGINSWLAQLLLMFFTFILVSKTFFDLNVVEQYEIYGGYFFVLAVGFTLWGVYRFAKRGVYRLTK